MSSKLRDELRTPIIYGLGAKQKSIRLVGNTGIYTCYTIRVKRLQLDLVYKC
jgi:hypothetical protein